MFLKELSRVKYLKKLDVSVRLIPDFSANIESIFYFIFAVYKCTARV